MNQEVNIKLKLTAEGIKKAEDDLKKLNKLKQQVETPGGAMGGSTGAKSAAFKGAEYGTARGTIGTGAEGRDFAKQSQGLGGLVRLYATYAANIFAVSAAFNALKDAMATTNMIEGLNQLGAQSGQSLGSLAKNFAAASGGAISLRDSMQATVQATSAGLSAKQFSQLGEVANKASKALGRDMPEAVSRLTRGITKLEPELLDELGIFTKVGKATEDYAKSVGKSVASLTDFEKRQAFANAVLGEGLTKFGAIDIAANPYDKLLASLKNVAQTGLETVNKVLGPLVNLLSSSPQALTVAIAGLGALLLKQAIPALGQYREGLKSSAAAASMVATARAKEAAKAVEETAAAREDALGKAADKELQKAKAAAASIEQARTSGFSKASEAARILKKETIAVNQTELDYLTKKGAFYEKQGKQNVADRYYGAVKAIEASAAAEKAYQVVIDETNKKLLAPGMFTPLGQAKRAEKRTADIAASKFIVSEAAERTTTIGPVASFKEMSGKIKESDMGVIRKGFTAISGAASIASTAIMGLVGALQSWIFIIGAVVAGIKMFDAWMTKNAEQAEAYQKAIDNSAESLKNYDRTIKSLSKLAEKNGGAVFSSEGLTAQANAFKELSDTLGTLREKFEELDKATMGWDRALDGVFSKSQGQSFAEASVANISKQIAAINNPELAASLTSEVSRILGTTGSGQLEWIEALKKGGPEAALAIKLIEDRLKPVSTALSNTTSRSKEFDDQFKKLSDSYRAFAFSVIDKSPMSALGDDMIAFAEKTIGALKDTEAGLASMSKLMQDNTKLGMFSPAVFSEMEKMKSEVESLNKLHGETTIKLAAARQEQAKLQLEYDKAEAAIQARINNSTGLSLVNRLGLTDPKRVSSALAVPSDKKKLDDAVKRADELNKQAAEEREKIAQIMANPVFKNLAIEAFKIGADLITKSIDFAFQKASLDVRRAIVGGLSELPGSAAVQRQIDVEDIQLQRDQLKMSADMIKAQFLTTAQLEKFSAISELNKAKSAASFSEEGGVSTNSTIAAREGMIKLTEQFDIFVKTGGKDTAGMMKILTQSMDTLGVEIEGAPAVIKAMTEAVKLFMSTAQAAAAIDASNILSIRTLNLRQISEEATTEQLNLDPLRKKAASAQTGVAILGQQNAFQTPGQVQAQAGAVALKAEEAFQTQLINIRKNQKTLQLDINAQIEEAMKTGEGLDKALQLDKSLKAKTTSEIEKATYEKANKLAEAGAGLSANLIKLLAEEAQRRLNIKQIIEETNNIRATTTIELNELELEYQIKLGGLSDQQIADARNLIETTKIQTEATSKLSSIELGYLSSRNKLMADFKSAAPGAAGEEIRKNAQAEMDANEKKYAAEVDGVNSVTAAKLKMKELDASISERQKAYEEIFKRAFEGMGDAIVGFVKTGKLEFGSLISDMLEGLVRYELKLQAVALYESAKTGMGGAGGIASFLGNLISGGAGGSTGGSIANFADEFGTFALSAKGNAFDSSIEKYAMGSAFDYGIKKYAKGGMFTNQVVDSPTLFKFAKGTGMMGEAGPEAIMPLKRDAQGNLGVRSGQQQGNVDVVVNNYGSESATATETTDSRGNRKIEVTIGEMTAGEVSRSGSASQKSLKTTYGLQPQLIRR